MLFRASLYKHPLQNCKYIKIPNVEVNLIWWFQLKICGQATGNYINITLIVSINMSSEAVDT